MFARPQTPRIFEKAQGDQAKPIFRMLIVEDEAIVSLDMQNKLQQRLGYK